MVISYLFDRRSKAPHTVCGYEFDITDYHPTKADLDSLRSTYDLRGEAAFKRLNHLRRKTRATQTARDEDSAEQQISNKTDLYAALVENKDNDTALCELWDSVNDMPSWVDWDQIERGQTVFFRYCIPFIVGLVYQSLLAGMGAWRIVETLSRTGGFQTNVARRRLLETTQFVLDCMQSPESLKPGGKGFASALRVRLLHCAVRESILDLCAVDPSYYDIQELGVPINDMDSISTIVSFSSTLIWISLPRQGWVNLFSYNGVMI